MPVSPQLKELLLQSLEHERGGVMIYETVLECVLNDDLREEWEKYLAQTRDHVDILTTACAAVGLDPDEMTPGRKIVEHNGKSLAVAMKMALAASDPPAAELVACECVVLAETKDHFDWELIGECAQTLAGDERAALEQAYSQVEDQEDEHLYHTKGWCSELWLQALGMKAVLPPPEEKRGCKDSYRRRQSGTGVEEVTSDEAPCCSHVAHRYMRTVGRRGASDAEIATTADSQPATRRA